VASDAVTHLRPDVRADRVILSCRPRRWAGWPS